jgi:lipopolysaccharide/colanic/teichoic acid biosynthesis glycosyltransferase
VTHTGRLIRRFRIDELPQLINVIRGEMSIVGPRPERPVFVDNLSRAVPLYDYRHCMQPGLTGWAQLNFPYGASVEDAREKLKYDLFYIKNASILFDFFILMQTLEVVIWGRAISMAGPRPREAEPASPSLRSVPPHERDVA